MSTGCRTAATPFLTGPVDAGRYFTGVGSPPVCADKSTLEVAFGQCRSSVDATAEAGCPSCGVISSRVRSRRPQRLHDNPVAGPIEVLRAKRRFFCDASLCTRQTFAEEIAQVRLAGSTRRLFDALVAAVIGSGRAAAEAAASFRVCRFVPCLWWLVQRALDAAVLMPPDVDAWHRGCSASMNNATGPCASSVSRQPRPGKTTNHG
ncbi:transposase family protein [Pseudarthrobacter sp. W1I19]|uniref:transposase family protein n=1 Tax=Pseudarthrobacter sp. W1I19 TaxID=3042288 RepID=UPI00359316A7